MLSMQNERERKRERKKKREKERERERKREREREREKERFYHLSKETKYINLIGKKKKNLEEIPRKYMLTCIMSGRRRRVN